MLWFEWKFEDANNNKKKDLITGIKSSTSRHSFFLYSLWTDVWNNKIILYNLYFNFFYSLNIRAALGFLWRVSFNIIELILMFRIELFSNGHFKEMEIFNSTIFKGFPSKMKNKLDYNSKMYFLSTLVFFQDFSGLIKNRLLEERWNFKTTTFWLQSAKRFLSV